MKKKTSDRLMWLWQGEFLIDVIHPHMIWLSLWRQFRTIYEPHLKSFFVAFFEVCFCVVCGNNKSWIFENFLTKFDGCCFLCEYLFLEEIKTFRKDKLEFLKALKMTHIVSKLSNFRGRRNHFHSKFLFKNSHLWFPEFHHKSFNHHLDFLNITTY